MKKIVFGTMTYDKEPYFSSMIRNIYDYAKKIVVIEGYVKDYWDLADCKWTEQKVVELDKEGKIDYKNLGKILDKNVLGQAILDGMQQYVDDGDWVLILGADELWTREALDLVANAPEDILWYAVPFDHFVGDFFHVIRKDWDGALKATPRGKAYDMKGNFLVNGMYEERAFRFFEGYNYKTNFTAVKDKEGRYLYADPYYTERRLYLPLDSPIKWMHYGYVGTRSWMIRKISFHHRRVVGDSLVGLENNNHYRMVINGMWNKSGNHTWIEQVDMNYNHPYPMEEHPYYGKTREEILNMEEWV